MDERLRNGLRAQRRREYGETRTKTEGLLRMVLAYPSPYAVAMSSLGFLQIYRLANGRAGTVCERAALPGDFDLALHRRSRTPLLTLETQRPVSAFDVLGISHAYELEGAGIVWLLELARLAPLARDRCPQDPLVVLGGPITFSNPLPYAPFADVVVLGEAEDSLDVLLERLEQDVGAARGDAAARRRLLDDLSRLPGFFVPTIHRDTLPPIAKANDERLPAHSSVFTPDTELADMQLIEPERGCHRGCTFCVMRRSTNGGMRLVEPTGVIERLHPAASRIGLVGAAVSDHPRILEILRALVEDRGLKVGISSLRADRLDEAFVSLLARGGYRSMTVALDAPSARQRDEIEKNLKAAQVVEAARLSAAHGMKHLKIYVIVGLPGERDEDIDELAAFALMLRVHIRVVLAVSRFVPKFHTPLADAPFADESTTRGRLARLRDKLAGRVEVRGGGVREASVEYRLAQGGLEHASAIVDAASKGGSLSQWRRSLGSLPERARPVNFAELVPAPTRRRRWASLASVVG